jgi:hypothetical protein
MSIASQIDRVAPNGWDWCLYGPCSQYKARAVFMSPDRKQYAAANGSDIDDAIRRALSEIKPK